jgi:glycosyltransferase involved in cell wall biosynthesis
MLMKEIVNKPGLLLIGNFMTGKYGGKCISAELSEYLIPLGWKIATSSSYTNRLLRLIHIILSIIFLRHKYSIVVIEVYSGLAFYLAETAVFFLKHLQKPYILALHGGGLPDFAQRQSQRMEKLLSGARLVITPSKYIQKELSNYRENIVYLPNGVAIENYHFRLRHRPFPRLCWLRAFHEIYNPLLAVEVIALLKPKFPDIQLTMIGPDKNDGTYAQVLQKIQDKGLSAHIHLAGAVSKQDVPQRLAEHDIFINTTRLESFGVGVMEAAAVGLPIITTNVGELPFLWTHEQDALLVPKDDPVAMASAVERVLTETGLAARLAANARKKAEEHDWPVIVSRWEQLIDQAQDHITAR